MRRAHGRCTRKRPCRINCGNAQGEEETPPYYLLPEMPILPEESRRHRPHGRPRPCCRTCMYDNLAFTGAPFTGCVLGLIIGSGHISAALSRSS